MAEKQDDQPPPVNNPSTLSRWIEGVMTGGEIPRTTDAAPAMMTKQEQHMQLALSLEREGICRVDRGQLPANMATDPGDSSLKGLLLGAISGYGHGPVPTVDQVERALNDFALTNRSNLRFQGERVIISAPVAFGKDPLSEADVKRLSTLAKGFGESLNVEGRLSLLVQYHEEHASRFTEDSWIQHLHLLMPRSLQDKVGTAVLNKLRLQPVFDRLVASHGTALSLSQLRVHLNRLEQSAATNDRALLDLVSAVEEAADKTVGDPSMVDTLCVEATLKIVGLTCDELTLSLIKSAMSTMTTRNMVDLSTMLRRDFPEVLAEAQGKRAQRKGSVNNVQCAEGQTLAESNQVDPPATSDDRDRCFRCDRKGHQARQCPTRIPGNTQTPERSGGRDGYNYQPRARNDYRDGGDRRTVHGPEGRDIPYCEATCVLHGHHSNGQCRQQLNHACEIQGHQTHPEALCRMGLERRLALLRSGEGRRDYGSRPPRNDSHYRRGEVYDNRYSGPPRRNHNPFPRR